MLPVILVLNNIRSLHNVGAIFRTAEAAGIEKLVLGGLTPHPDRHEVGKTALGTMSTLSWEHLRDIRPFLQDAQEDRYTLVSLEQTPQATDLFQTEVPFPMVLIVGHERMGVEPEILSLCSHHVYLPMQGTAAHSLNVSNATAIALYELGRRVWYN